MNQGATEIPASPPTTVAAIAAYGLAILAFSADVLQIWAYLGSVRKRRWQDAPAKVLVVVALFLLGVGLVWIGRNSRTLDHVAVVSVFSWVYFGLALLTLLIASYNLKGKQRPLADYVAYSVSSFVVFVLGILLLFVSGTSARALAYAFFGCAVLQGFMVAGEYGLKRVLQGENRPLPRVFLAEFAMFRHHVKDQALSLARIFSEPEEEGSPDDVGLPGMDHRALGLDLALLSFTFTLGVALLLVNTTGQIKLL